MRRRLWPALRLTSAKCALLVRQEITLHLEDVYNRKRLHSSIGYLSAVEFEDAIFKHEIHRGVRASPVAGRGHSMHPAVCTGHLDVMPQNRRLEFHLVDRIQCPRDTTLPEGL